MAQKKRAFVSFDYDHDADLKTLLVGQSKHEDTPFDLADWSIKEAIDKNWKDHARKRIKSVDVVIVICAKRLLEFHPQNTVEGRRRFDDKRC
jgi:hypothetical protein